MLICLQGTLYTHTYTKKKYIYTHSICSSVHVHSKVRLNKIFFEILIRHRYLTFVKIKSKGIYNVTIFILFQINPVPLSFLVIKNPEKH